MTCSNFADYINQTKPSAAAVQQAAILYIGEITDDLPADELREKVGLATNNPALVENAFSDLRKDHEAADAIFLDFLANQWQQPGNEEKIRRAFEAAEKKLPVIETIIIGSAALYAMYLTAYVYYVDKTGGAKKTVRKVKRKPDGSVEENETTEYVPPATPHSAVSSLYSMLKNSLTGKG
jgi:hypothetical protein